MKITKSKLKQIIKEELQEMQEFDPSQELDAQGLSRDETLYYEPEDAPSSPHTGKSVEEIVRWHTDKWDKNIRDYSQMMPPELLGPLINPMMYQVVDSMREPGVKDEYYAHLSDEEYDRLESILNAELERRKI